ncbi:glycosyltransferase 87 family protein [Streptomyces sp. VNUA116]|uniref:glycosyltransferase 87 family protein n=1 Tax=Streptomyces sp. VNUA116 TaxID=3062449 RepID=UPI002676B590|nr:glycosyltransferase 87 family protein [Streptomyces sp. VNUA116]WKU48699.1 glycosyltransferase 87 family protein [Streptomyces sp. VNUA116]
MSRGTVLSWLLRHATAVLACSVLADLLMAVFVESSRDLQVYYHASPQLLHGHLYDFELAPPDRESRSLPFTYPPFAAVVLLPLSLLPWPLTVLLWHMASLVAIALLVHRSFSLLSRAPVPDRRYVMLWTAPALWLEPVRHALGLGQIGPILAALTLYGATHPRAAAAGGWTGVPAGIKLTPAVNGLYFLASGRWRAALHAAGAFTTTVALAWILSPGQSLRYWGSALADTRRVGAVGGMENQSLAGCLARLTGHPDGPPAPLLTVVLCVTAALTATALIAAVRRHDVLGAVIGV